MSLVEANAFAFSLATSLMVSIVIFRAGDGTLTVVRADEYEGEVSQIVREIDGFLADMEGRSRSRKRPTSRAIDSRP